MTTLKISLFGTVRIQHVHCSTETKITPKAQLLLAYLLLQGPRLHSREVLIDLFWEDYPLDRARNALKTTLWRLRRALEPEPISAGTYLVRHTGGEIGFNWDSNVWIDVIAFEKQISRLLAQPVSTLQPSDRQTLEATLQLYSGDLLECFYDDWIISEQERLRCLYLDGLEHLMRYYHQHSLFDKSLACGRQILEREPLREEVHRAMMRLYLENGQRALAVRQYETCRHILLNELDIAPVPETQALYAQALDKNGPPQTQTMVQVEQTDLQQAVEQLSQAVHGFGTAQYHLEHAAHKLKQAHNQLRRALQLIRRVSK